MEIFRVGVRVRAFLQARHSSIRTGIYKKWLFDVLRGNACIR